jgi:hypothetical protein
LRIVRGLAVRIEIEQLKADYFDSTALKESPIKLRRTNIKGKRYYYTAIDGKIKLYPSATTITKAVLPTSPYLISWISSLGEKEAKRYSISRAHYGSIMHIAFSKFLIAEEMNIPDDLEEIFNEYAENNNIQIEPEWCDDLAQDMIGFAQFGYEYDIEPIAIEIPLKCDGLGFACTVDLIARITVEEKGFYGEVYKSGPRKGESKETKQRLQKVAIIDYKSGRKGSYLDNEIQLELCKQAVIENFPELGDQMILNYHPKDWKSKPGYTINNQTGKHTIEVLKAYMEIYNSRFKIGSLNQRMYQGELKLRYEPDEAFHDFIPQEMLPRE